MRLVPFLSKVELTIVRRSPHLFRILLVDIQEKQNYATLEIKSLGECKLVKGKGPFLQHFKTHSKMN